ncbi:hypothetical protein F2Q68_00019474 [Brassica cretica]|uniref:Replication protein A 70 kDa DNA-binding subunit B/D first OB fold domain-containing protein n=1 Tax=Brassica cretica TaxID=69181 RepID=A0A8S9FVC2_BRACR|nr:hypothetical protein F2Q68_00019474 [Brassica cretica]
MFQVTGLLRFWDSLNFKKDNEFMRITVLFLDEKIVIHGYIPVERANHYMPYLKVGSIVKVDSFEVAKCSSMYQITDHPFLIRFIPSQQPLLMKSSRVLLRSISSHY